MIYVDDMRSVAQIPRPLNWRYNEFCHMFADSAEELHAFAKKIGLRKSWFQEGRIGHYDLTRRKREIAVALGAKEISTREYILMLMLKGV